MSTTNLDQFIKLFRSINQYDIDNALTFEIHEPGSITYKMTIAEKHLSSPNTAHGAVVAGFMDCVLGLSALSEAVTHQNLTSTVEFKINYVRPVTLGEEITGTGKVVHKGKTLLISSGEVRNAKGDLIALGQGTFNTYPFSKKDFAHELTSTPRT
jgi:uncharacterized protein (TIGR00369 family)